MADKVRDRLKDLAAFLENEHAVESIEESLDHLQRAVADCMVRSRALAQQATIFLFQSREPPSLIEFLDASGVMGEDMRKRQISHARIKVLELLGEFVKTYGSHVAVTRTHIVGLVRRCQVMARADWSNKVRAVALDVVVNVLKYADSRVTAEEMDPAGYVDKLFHDLKFSKASQTAKGTMLEVVGHIATVFPTYVKSKVPELLPWIEDTLEKQFATNAPEMLLINGLLEALARLLVFDAARYSKGKDGSRQKIYTYLHRILTTTVDGQLSRYQVTKAALQFLAIHATVFGEEIGANAYTWFSLMKFCTLSNNKTVKENAFAAADSVMQVVGKYLGAETKDEQRKKSLNRLLKDLLPVLADASARGSTVAFALQSLGYLAPSVLLYLSESGFLKIEDRLRKFGENLLVLDDRATAARWSTFSSFLECIVYFAKQPRTKELDDGYINFLEDIIIHMLNAYPHCVWKTKMTLYKTILQIIRASLTQSTSQRLTSRVVKHLFLLTLSNVTDLQDMIILYHPETGSAETKLLYEFEDLWVALLRGIKHTRYKSKDITVLKNQVYKNDAGHTEPSLVAERQRVLNALLQSFAEIVGSLDLSYQYDLQEARTGMSSGGYKPKVPRDHSIMLNLTDFVERLFPRLEPQHLRFWIPTTMIAMFQKARQLPLVSAFYRITRVLAAMADSLQIFVQDNQPIKAECGDEVQFLRSQYEAFIGRTVHNIRFYKDELLVATSGCILATPLSLLHVEDYANAVVPALLIGRSFLPAAEMAISSLEIWQKLDSTRLESIFERVIPCLAVYLDQSDHSSVPEGDSVATSSLEKTAIVTEASNDSDWGKLQRRVVVLLGKAGGKAALLLSQNTSVSGEKSRRGFSGKLLDLPIKLGDILVDLSLDNLFSHIGCLACESTDRRVKTAACEIYHALVCYLCGKTATHPHTSGSKSAYFDLWKTVFPVVVTLATDAEKISRSLFEPLLFQVTRWLCHGSETFPHEFSAVMDELIDGLSHETSTTIREVSGKCLSTCLTSAVEVGGNEPTKGLSKADVVFQRLFSLCRHPGPAQRTGAATAISYFLRTLREDNVVVVQTFGLRCLKNFLFSLKLCGHDAQAGKTNVQILEDMITKAINKLQRAVVRYPSAFTRSKPVSLDADQEKNHDEDLGSFTEWLFLQCASRGAVYRASCRQLFLAFSPIVSGSNAKAWIERYASTMSEPIHSVLAPPDQLAVLIHTEERTNWNLHVTFNWLDQLTASTECYTWCSSILGGEAHKHLCTPGSSSLKRKETASATAHVRDGQLAISWAVKAFLRQFTPMMELQRDTSSLLDFDHRFALLRSLVRTAAVICDFLSAGSGMASEIVGAGEIATQRALSNMIIEALALGRGTDAQEDGDIQERLNKLKQFSRHIVQEGGDIALELMESATKYTERVCTSVTSSTSSEEKRDKPLVSLQTVNELLDCGAVSPSKLSNQTGELVHMALIQLEHSQASPEHRSLAVEAMKIAFCCGWNVGKMFDDETLGRGLADIYAELLGVFPIPQVWHHVVRELVRPNETFALRLATLVDVLKQVVSLKAFASRSSAVDAFVQTYTPHLKELLSMMSGLPALNDEQKSRILLEVILESVPVFGSCSKQVVSTLSADLFVDIRKCVLSMLGRREYSHFVKADCLAVLGGLGPTQDLSGNKQIQQALSSFVIDEFPITSTDVARGSRDFDVFRMLLGKLLSVVEEFRRADYLPAIYFALKEGDQHLFVDDIRASLGKLATAVTSHEEAASSDTAQDAIAFMVELAEILTDSGVDQNVRKSLLDHLFVPVLELQSPRNLGQFYMAKVLSNTAVISKLATIVANSGEIVSPGAFLTAAVAFSLVEVLYRLVDPDHIRGEINTAFLGHGNGKGREFTMLVCKCASKFVTKSYDDVNDHTRFTCWKAYNCLLTAVSRTQKQEKFFDQILFQDSLWANIVDNAREYELPTETKPFDRVPLSSISATTLRQQLQQRGDISTQSGGRRGSSRRDSTASLRFFTGSSLSQISLSADSSQYAFGSVELMQREAIYEGMEIELDSINDHPCMIPLLRVLKQMKFDFGKGWSAASMPTWMRKIFDVVANPTTELNIRLFIVKIVLDAPDVFARYSSMWADKMMDALLEATVSSSSGKPAEFHYLLRDCCMLLIDDWKEIEVVTMRTTASRFLNELIELAPNEEHNLIMQDNLTLITQLILQWKPHIRIDVAIVSNLLLLQNENPRREAANRYSALQIISAMLSADMADVLLTPDYLNPTDSNSTLEDGIIQAMEHKRPSVYNVAAEVSGLLLAGQDKAGAGLSSQTFRTKLLERITAFYNGEDFGRFLALLRSVSLHDANVLDSTMLHRLSFVLPKVVAIESWSLSAVECLENATRNNSVQSELFTHCQSVLGRFLSHRNSAVQLHAVRLVQALVPHLDDLAITRLVESEQRGGHDLFQYSLSQQDPLIRRVFINLASALFEKQLDKSIADQIREQLLRGLADSDAEIRQLAHNFWKSSAIKQTTCSDCLIKLFHELFAAPAADVWVFYATNLLLDMNVCSDDHDALLFQSALSQDEFHEANIDSAWESKDETMTPLFSVEADLFSASTMLAKSSMIGSFSSQAFFLGSSESQMETGLSSQSQLISSSLASQEWDSSSLSQGEFGFSQTGSSQQPRRPRRFVKRSAGGASKNEVTQTGSKHARHSDKNFFQERYAVMKKNEEALRNRQRKARTQQVVMQRKYRTGDYPDIQIKLLDIVKPLMGLCEMHGTTSSIVLTALIPAILTSKKLSRDSECLRQLGSNMERALVEGKHSLMFVGTIHLAYLASIMKDSNIVKQVGISYRTIGASSLASSSNLSGELLLEEYLNLEAPRSRDEAAECWDQLYKILATNQKSNLLVALASKSCTVEDSKLALQAQLAGDLPGAIASYRKAESILESELELQPEDALLAARFELHRSTWERYGCMERLNQWEKLHREFLNSSEDFEFVWQEESPYLEQGIGHCLRSLVGSLSANSDISIEDSEVAEQLQSFQSKAQQDPHRWAVVMSRFGVEISLASITMGDVGRARVEIEQVYGVLLKRWTATSKIARLSRLELLQNLSSAVEIDEALTLSSKLQLSRVKSEGSDSFVQFTQTWSQVFPSLGEGSMAAWSQFYMVQSVLSNFIKLTGKHEGVLLTEAVSAIHQAKAQLMLRYAGASVESDVLALASKYLKDFRELCNAESLPKVSVLMVDVFVSHVLKLAERQAQKTSLNGARLAPDAVAAITRYYQTATKMFDNADILDLVEKLPLADRVAMESLEAKTFAAAAQFYMAAGLDAAATEELFIRGFDAFQRSSQAIPVPAASVTSDCDLPALHSELKQSSLNAFARCRATFIEFLIDVLFSANPTEWSAFVNRKILVVALMENVLGGMASGNQECANYFPQLCEILPSYPELVDDFEKRVLTQIPIWTCLRWSSQLLALVNGEIGSTIVKILEKMAAEYPVALFYDFKITFGDVSSRPCASNVDLSRLALLVSNPVMEKFVDALRLIHHPELRLKEGLRELANLVDEGKKAAAKAKVAHIWQDCFASEHPRLGSKIGHYNRDWARRAKRDVGKIMGRDGADYTAKTVLAAREWIANNFNVIPGKHGITKDMKARLADFADWLDEFDHSRARLELPGQYTTRWGKPDPSSHVHVLSIHSTLGVLASKQLPKQITLHCSDQNNYTFLVKGGEDLRLDQRIEQLFDVMNQILSSDPRCRDRALRTKTYKVIPMTTEIGMIEWLHGTSTLKGIIEKQLQHDPRCQQLQSNKRAKLQLFNTIPAKQYESFLLKQRGSSFAAKVAGPSRDEVVANFDTVQDLIPRDLLRRQLFALAADLEDFISIRDEFVSSLAVFSACSYILGIGDRHLDNFLMDHHTGRVIGIDFGVSFGAGASVLPVPELIPFRFTRQMESVLLPYDSANLLVQDMHAVFEALRDKKQVIESVMNVFLHEPLLDWQQSTTTYQNEIFKDASISEDATQVDNDVVMADASNSLRTNTHSTSNEASTDGRSTKRAKMDAIMGTSSSLSSSSSAVASSSASLSSSAPVKAWLPDVKIAIARRKLDGLSPRVLLKEELAQNLHLGKHLKHFQALVDTAVAGGAPQSAAPMSSLAQAQELVALATAPDLLGRTYHGWMPWL